MVLFEGSLWCFSTCKSAVTTYSIMSIADVIVPGKEGQVVLIGFPFDEADVRSGAKPGASGGPAAVRKQLATRLNGAMSMYTGELQPFKHSISDAGDISGANYEDAKKNLQALVKELLANNAVPIVIGGSADVLEPVANALNEHTKNTLVLSVSPKLGLSGKDGNANFLASTVSREGPVSMIICYDDDATLPDELGRAKSQSIQKYGRSELSGEDVGGLFRAGREMPGVVGFDMASYPECPGATQPALVGLSVEQALKHAERAGQANLRAMTIGGFNPAIEEDRTARIVATMIRRFLVSLPAPGQGGNDSD